MPTQPDTTLDNPSPHEINRESQELQNISTLWIGSVCFKN